MFLELLTKTSRMPEVTFHYWFFGRFIIPAQEECSFPVLLNFGLLFSHLIHHWRFQRVALNLAKPQNKLGRSNRKSISLLKKNPTPCQVVNRLPIRYSKIF